MQNKLASITNRSGLTDTENKPNRWLPVVGEGQHMGRGKHKLLGVREAQGCVIPYREYSQHCTITVNGN